MDLKSIEVILASSNLVADDFLFCSRAVCARAAAGEPRWIRVARSILAARCGHHLAPRGGELGRGFVTYPDIEAIPNQSIFH